jgi:hypothetical protein
MKNGYLVSYQKNCLLMSVFGSDYRDEQLFRAMKNVKSKVMTHLIYEHLERCSSQQQKLNLILNDYSSKISVRFLTD